MIEHLLMGCVSSRLLHVWALVVSVWWCNFFGLYTCECWTLVVGLVNVPWVGYSYFWCDLCHCQCKFLDPWCEPSLYFAFAGPGACLHGLCPSDMELTCLEVWDRLVVLHGNIGLLILCAVGVILHGLCLWWFVWQLFLVEAIVSLPKCLLFMACSLARWCGQIFTKV